MLNKVYSGIYDQICGLAQSGEYVVALELLSTMDPCVCLANRQVAELMGVLLLNYSSQTRGAVNQALVIVDEKMRPVLPKEMHRVAMTGTLINHLKMLSKRMHHIEMNLEHRI